MTVETQSGGEPILKSGPYNGNGVTAVFDYDFPIQAAGELEVVRENADTTTTVLTLTTHYTVAGVAADAGGQITLVDPATDLPTGTRLIIRYNGDFMQLIDWSNQSSLQLAQVERTLDKQMMHIRQMQEQLNRALLAGQFDVGASFSLPSASSLKYLRWNVAADALENASIADASAVDLPVTVADNEVPRWDGVSGTVFDQSGVYITDEPRLGVGTATPAADVDVSSAAPTVRLTDSGGGYAQIDASDGNVRIMADEGAGVASSFIALDVDGTEYARLSASGQLGLGTTSPSYSLDLGSKTDAMRLPVGTTAQRPTGAAGVLRYNSTLVRPEYHDGTDWQEIVAGGMELIVRKTASGSAQLDFTEFDASIYRSYLFTFDEIQSATNNVNFLMRFSSDGGSTFESGAADTAHVTQTVRSTLVVSTGAATAISLASALGNFSNEQASGQLTLIGMGNSGKYPRVISQMNMDYEVDGTLMSQYVVGRTGSLLEYDAVRFLMSSGNIFGGVISMYGLR